MMLSVKSPPSSSADNNAVMLDSLHGYQEGYAMVACRAAKLKDSLSGNGCAFWSGCTFGVHARLGCNTGFTLSSTTLKNTFISSLPMKEPVCHACLRACAWECMPVSNHTSLVFAQELCIAFVSVACMQLVCMHACMQLVCMHSTTRKA